METDRLTAGDGSRADKDDDVVYPKSTQLTSQDQIIIPKKTLTAVRKCQSAISVIDALAIKNIICLRYIHFTRS